MSHLPPDAASRAGKPVRLAVTALSCGIVARSDTVAVVAIRASTLAPAVVHTRALTTRALRLCRNWVSTSSTLYALLCDVIAWGYALRVEGEQVRLTLINRHLRGAHYRRTVPGFGLVFVASALYLGAKIRPLLVCHFGIDRIGCLFTTATILLGQLGLFRLVVRLPELRRALGYQRVLEECLYTWRTRTLSKIQFVPARSLFWSGPRCFFEAALGGVAVTELCESLLSLLVPGPGATNAGALARFTLASIFALQWSMVLCLMRRNRVVPPAQISRWLGLVPAPPPRARHLVMLALERFERGSPQAGRPLMTQQGLWPSLAGAPMRERTKRCSINWWHSRPDSKSSIAA